MKQPKPRTEKRKQDRDRDRDRDREPKANEPRSKPMSRRRAVIVAALAVLGLGAIAAGLAATRSVSGERGDGLGADPRAWTAEARRLLAADRAGQAERLLERASALDPANGEAWVLRLELLRAEDRIDDARRIGMTALDSVLGNDRLAVLRSLTVALLTQAPESQARTVLNRWVEADPLDFQARTALLRRISANPRRDDPDQAARVARLHSLLADRPDEPQIRTALIESLGDAGWVEEGERLLREWPEGQRDARYHRLRGRWDLDYRRDPQRAVEAFRRALAELPHDWRTRSQLSHALFAMKDADAADREAREAGRLRVILEPFALRRRLESALKLPLRPESARDLAELCRSLGLTELSAFWEDAPNRLSSTAR